MELITKLVRRASTIVSMEKAAGIHAHTVGFGEPPKHIGRRQKPLPLHRWKARQTAWFCVVNCKTCLVLAVYFV
jgi:hypothetical protein